MRFTSPLCAILLSLLGHTVFAQNQGGSSQPIIEQNNGYVAGLPLGKMGANANTIHSLAMRGFYFLPMSSGRASIGLELTAGSYASFTRTQPFGMNGVETPAEVTYNSNVTATSAIFRYDLLQAKNLVVFGGAKGGFAGFKSELVVEDPDDPDGCKALDKKNLITDHTWIAGLQAGAMLDARAFIKMLPPNTLMLQAHTGYVQGGNVDYINVKNTSTDDHSGHSHNATSPEGGRALDVRFINMQTGAQHSHEVARVYNSPVQFLECGLSLVIRF